VLPPNAPAVGRPLRELDLPRDCTISVVIRNGQPIFPDGDTRLAAGDEVVAMTTPANEGRLRDLLLQPS
jgi:trk system potassium uptake protein TrkA